MLDFNKNLFVKISNLFNSGSMLGRSSRQYYGQEGIGDVFAEAKAICEVEVSTKFMFFYIQFNNCRVFRTEVCSIQRFYLKEENAQNCTWMRRVRLSRII